MLFIFAGPEGGIIRLDLFLQFLVHGAVSRRHGIIWCALKHGQMFRLFGNDRDRLNGRRPSADNANPFAGKIHPFMRPFAGVINLALEAVSAFEVWCIGRRQAARRHDAIGGGHCVAIFRGHGPAVCGLIKHGRFYPRVELNVLAHVKAVGDMVEIFQNDGLRRIAFRPLPFLLQGFIELERIFHAFHITARAGITVPVPGAANARAGLQHSHRKPLFAQPVEHGQAAKACTHDNGVIAGERRFIAGFLKCS